MRLQAFGLTFVLPVALVLLLYTTAWNGGLLADELPLMSYLVNPGPAGPQVDWQRVVDDFSGPWAFGFGQYYRPLVTLSLALDWQLGQGAEWVFHASAIMMWALCVATWTRLLSHLFGPKIAGLSALWLLSHPAAHEPICWPCTRADFMVLIACGLAAIAFVRHLHGHPGRQLLRVQAWAIVALLCKEVGVLLPAWLLLLDLGVRGWRAPLGPRLRLHLQLVPLLILYLLWRWWILGSPSVDPGASLGERSWSTWFWLQANKLQACVAPAGDHMPSGLVFACLAAFGWMLTQAWRAPTGRRWTVVAAAWVVVAFLPAQWHNVTANLGNSRMVVAALPAFALLFAVALSNAKPRWSWGIGLLLLVVSAGAMAQATCTLQSSYQRAWRAMEILREQFDRAGQEATVAEPLVLLAAVAGNSEVPFLLPPMAAALARTPLARRDHPFASLAMSLVPGVGPEMLERPVAPWRVLWRAGAKLCYWSAQHTDSNLVTLPVHDPAATVVFTQQGQVFVPSAALSALAIDTLELRGNAPFGAGTLTWHTAAGQSGTVAFPGGERQGDAFSAQVDLGGDFEFTLWGALSGVAAFTPVPADASSVDELRVLPPLPPVPLRAPLRDRQLALADLPRHIADNPPADGVDTAIRIVCVDQACGFAIDLTTTRPPEAPWQARMLLTELDRFVTDDRVYYFVEFERSGRRRHSELDWFRREMTPR